MVSTVHRTLVHSADVELIEKWIDNMDT